MCPETEWRPILLYSIDSVKSLYGDGAKGVAYLAKFKVQLQEMENEPMNEAAFVIVVIKLTKSICNDEKKDNL